MTWEYYGFGNTFLIRDILLGVKGIVALDDYKDLIVIVSLAAFFVYVPLKAVTNKLQDVLIYILIVGVISAVLFNKTEDIVVIDKLAMTPNYTITDVPMIFAIPLVATNKIGWQISEWYETHMASSIDPALQLTGGSGFAAGSALLRDMQGFNITNSDLSFRLGAYLRDCVVPEFYIDPANFDRIHNSKDVWAELEVTDPMRSTVESATSVLSCVDAYEYLTDTYFDDDVVESFLQNHVGAKPGANSILSSGLTGIASNTGVLTAITNELGGGALTGNSFLLGNILAPEIRRSAQDVAVLTGSNEFIASLNIEQARRSQSAGWLTTSMLFQDMAGYLFSGLTLFTMGLMPIILLGLFIPKFGTKIVGMYLKILVWLLLWWPGLAIVNHISQGYLIWAVSGGGGGWWDASNAPWAIQNAPVITDYAANASMAAGFLATIVPMVMWGIISGSGQAFTAALQGASGRAEAQRAAGNISAESYSEGEVSYNNISANKHNTVHEIIEGNKPKETYYSTGGNTIYMDHGGVQSWQSGMQETVKNRTSEDSTTSLATRNSDTVDTTIDSGFKKGYSDLMGLVERTTNRESFDDSSSLGRTNAANDNSGGEIFVGSILENAQSNMNGNRESFGQTLAGAIMASAGVSAGVSRGSSEEVRGVIEQGFINGSTPEQLELDLGALNLDKGDVSTISRLFGQVSAAAEAKASLSGQFNMKVETTNDAAQTTTDGQSDSSGERRWESVDFSKGVSYGTTLAALKSLATSDEAGSELRSGLEKFIQENDRYVNSESASRSKESNVIFGNSYETSSPVFDSDPTLYEKFGKSGAGIERIIDSDSMSTGVLSQEALDKINVLKDELLLTTQERTSLDDAAQRLEAGFDRLFRQEEEARGKAGELSTSAKRKVDEAPVDVIDDVGKSLKENETRLRLKDGERDLESIKIGKDGEVTGEFRPEGLANIGTNESPKMVMVYSMIDGGMEMGSYVIGDRDNSGARPLYSVPSSPEYAENLESYVNDQSMYRSPISAVAAGGIDLAGDLARWVGNSVSDDGVALSALNFRSIGENAEFIESPTEYRASGYMDKYGSITLISFN